MRQYRMQETQEIDKVFCNQCGKEIPVVNGRIEAGVFSTEYEWGYFSEKDGELHAFDLCEECYDRLVRGFLTPIEIKTKNEY
ncbi:hypothetical protein ACTQ6A_08650 [Lachnospiraceae bacterium LCP25S3_G4]